MAYVRLQMNLPHPAIRSSMLLAGPPLPYSSIFKFMDDPMRQLFETMFCETLCETTVCETMFGHYALKGKT